MNHIYPINEFLGVSTHLDNLAIQVIDKIQDNIDKPVRIKKHGVDVVIKSACQIKIPLQGKTATINLQFGDRPIHGYAAHVGIENMDNYEFNLYTSRLQVPLIVHELKHIDRLIARKFKFRGYDSINHVGTDVVKHLPDSLFYSDISKDILKDSFYFLDPEEYEAYYNDIYRLLKSKVKPDMTKEEKRIFIKRILKVQKIYKYYNFYIKKGGFDIEDFFKNRSACNYFLQIFLEKYEQYIKGEEYDFEYDDWSNVKKEVEDLGEDIKINSLAKEINTLLTKQVFKGYRKFTRYYSIFL